MNTLKPENVVFVPKFRGKNLFLSCFLSLLIFVLGIVIALLLTAILNY